MVKLLNFKNTYNLFFCIYLNVSFQIIHIYTQNPCRSFTFSIQLLCTPVKHIVLSPLKSLQWGDTQFIFNKNVITYISTE